MKFVSLKNASDRAFTPVFGVNTPPVAASVSVPDYRKEYRFPAQELDKAVGPLESGKVYAIGARPGIGKTSVALDCAITNAMETGRPVYFISSEMYERDVILRAAFVIHGRTAADLAGEERLRRTWGIMRTLPVYLMTDWTLDDEPTIEHIHRILKGNIRNSLIIFDSSQFFATGCDGISRISAEQLFASEVKGIAEDCSSAVIVTSHLPRSVEARPDRMPKTEDIPEHIRLKVDCLIALSRKDYYDSNAAPGFTAAVNKGDTEGDIIIEFPEIQCDKTGTSHKLQWIP